MSLSIGLHIDKQERRLYALSVMVLFASVALYAYTSITYILAAPFAIPVFIWLSINWKSFYWFYVLCVPLTIVGQFGGSVQYIPQLPFTLILAFTTIMLLLYNRKIVQEQVLRHPLTLIIFLQYCWLIVAVLFSQIPFLSFKYLGVNTIQLLTFFVLPSIIIQSKTDVNRLLKLFLVPMAIIATLILLKHASYKFDYVASNKAVKPFFINHVDHGTIMSMLVPVFFIIWRYNKGKKNSKLYFGLFILFVIGMYFTYARAAILGTGFAFVVFWCIRKRLVNLLMPLFVVMITSTVVFMVDNNQYIQYHPTLHKTYSRKSFKDLIQASFVGGDMSSMERFYRWIAAVRMSEERPLVGVGPNNFYSYYKPHTVTVFQTYVSRNPEKSTTHNYFLFLLVEQGWPAMLLYLLLIAAIFYHAQRLYYRSNDDFYKNIVLASAMMIAAFFINNLFSELLQTYKIGMMFYLGLILLIWVNRKIKEENKTRLA